LCRIYIKVSNEAISNIIDFDEEAERAEVSKTNRKVLKEIVDTNTDYGVDVLYVNKEMILLAVRKETTHAMQKEIQKPFLVTLSSPTLGSMEVGEQSRFSYK
jgi:hypothetical protein